jgi:hypothetical protein
MRKEMQPSILIGELYLYFCFLAIVLDRFFLTCPCPFAVSDHRT